MAKFWQRVYLATSYSRALRWMGGRNRGGQNAIARFAVRRYAAAARG